MFMLAALYIAFGFGALAALAIMLLRVRTLLGNCPQSSATAGAAAVTITPGFGSIGAGGVILVGAVLPLLSGAPLAGFLGALCFGLGFTQAVGTLRTILYDQAKEARAI